MNKLTNKNLFSQISASIFDIEAPLIRHSDGSITPYADMLARSAQFANVLTGLGVEPGDRVAVQVEKSIDAIFLYLGCVRAGGVFLPLNTGYQEKELGYFLGDAKPKLLVCASERLDALSGLATKENVAHLESLDQVGGSLIEKANAAGNDFKDVFRSSDDLAAILYTSGTTGRSKGAMLTHENLLSNAIALIDYWQFRESDVLLHVLPIFHTHGLFVATNVVLLSGASMVFQHRFDVDQVLAALPNISVMMGVPTFYVRLLSANQLNQDLTKNIRLFISGSAPLSPQTHQAFAKRTGHTILERYGMTETNMNTSNPYSGERRPGTVGLPLPGIDIRICDQTSKALLKAGEVGMIEVRGPNVFKGYWQMPDKTKAEFREDDYFITGDLGYIDEDGYISIVGRDKDLIISGGFNVYPAEVENAIDAIEGVAEVAVVGVPHPDFGEGVTAIVVTNSNTAPNAEQIKAILLDEIAKYKIPKKLYFIEALPRNKMGKVQKKQLREQYQNTYLEYG